MGWAIRTILLFLSILLISLLFLSIPTNLDPALESALVFLVVTLGVNLIIGFAALFKFSSKN